MIQINNRNWDISGGRENSKIRRTLVRIQKHLMSPFHALIWDYFFSFFVCAPLVISFWRGTWRLCDQYLPEDLGVSGWISYVLGLNIILLLTFLQDKLDLGCKKIALPLFIIISKIFMYILALGNVIYWRGIWYIWDAYAGKTMTSGLASFAFGLILLCCSSSVNNLAAPPAKFVVDKNINVFEKVKPKFGTSWATPVKYIGDVLFTVCIVQGLIVFVWRGLWVFLNSVMFPTNVSASALISMFAGYCICLICAFLQHPASWASKKLEKWKVPKLIFQQSFWFLVFFGSMNVWRGVWLLTDQVFLWEYIPLSYWVSHFIGLCLFPLLMFGNTTFLQYQIDGVTTKLDVNYLKDIFVERMLPICSLELPDNDMMIESVSNDLLSVRSEEITLRLAISTSADPLEVLETLKSPDDELEEIDETDEIAPSLNQYLEELDKQPLSNSRQDSGISTVTKKSDKSSITSKQSRRSNKSSNANQRLRDESVGYQTELEWENEFDKNSENSSSSLKSSNKLSREKIIEEIEEVELVSVV